MVSVAYGQVRIQGVGLGVCIFPSAIFKNAFDVYNFSIISNLFDSYKPYAQHAQPKMCGQNASYLAKHSEIGSKNLNKYFAKIIQRALK